MTSKIVGEYYRSRDGHTIHLAPCLGMGRAERWGYADQMSMHEVVGTVRSLAPDLRLCKQCWPPAAVEASHA